MEITVGMQLASALFWTLTALVGMSITIPVLVTAHRGWKRISTEGLDRGMAIMAFSHVQGDALRVSMHTSFFVLGGIRLAGPPFVMLYAPSPLLYWAGLLALTLVPLELITVTLLSRRARRLAAQEMTRGRG